MILFRNLADRRGAGPRAVITCVATALLQAACGGGGDGASTAPSPTGTSAPNRAPIVVNPLPDAQGIGQHAFSYDISATTFADPDGDTLTYVTDAQNPPLRVVDNHITGTLPPRGPLYVNVIARDQKGGFVSTSLTINITPNAPPAATSPNLAVMTTPGTTLNYDPTRGGSTFTDPDGDRLTYSLALLSAPNGLAIDGTRVVGALSGIGVVTFEISATDEFGATGKDRFSVALAAPEPTRPNLPASNFVYVDEQLPLPDDFRLSSVSAPFGTPLWDSQPLDNRTTNAGATLGRVLFYDKRLSLTNTHACGSCHHQANGFASPVRFNVGAQGVPMKRNTMALVNARYNIQKRWFSDARATSLRELVLMPIQEPTELANFLPLLEQKLAATDFYPPLFAAAFGTPEITSERIARALAQFVQALISYRTKYDDAYSWDDDHPTLLTAQELLGQGLFENALPCSRCHAERVQMLFEPKSNGIDAVTTDPGYAGRGQFRATSLRNIAVTAPYMHDGRFATLREVIDQYDHGIQDHESLADELRKLTPTGLPGPPIRLNMTEDEKDALEAFLRMLTDDAFLKDPKFSDPFL